MHATAHMARRVNINPRTYVSIHVPCKKKHTHTKTRTHKKNSVIPMANEMKDLQPVCKNVFKHQLSPGAACYRLQRISTESHKNKQNVHKA